MKGLAITSKGIEDIAALEIKEILNVTSEENEGMCVFDVKSKEDLCLLSYKAQSVNKILLLLNEGIVKDLENDPTDFSEWLKGTFRVSSQVENNEMSTDEVNQELGGALFEKYKAKVDLNNPDVIVFVYVAGEKYYVGIDFSGVDLHKRSYKLFGHKVSLRGTIAYALVRISGWKPGEFLVDPFLNAGTIPIEAAHFALGFPLRHYDKDKLAFTKFIEFDFDKVDKKIKDEKLKIYGYDDVWLNLNNAKKNAKIAGILKSITFSKIPVEDLELKHEKIDHIICHVPQMSRHTIRKQVEQQYTQLCKQAKITKANLVVTGHNLDDFKKICKLKIKEERKIWMGKKELTVLVINK